MHGNSQSNYDSKLLPPVLDGKIEQPPSNDYSESYFWQIFQTIFINQPKKKKKKHLQELPHSQIYISLSLLSVNARSRLARLAGGGNYSPGSVFAPRDETIN